MLKLMTALAVFIALMAVVSVLALLMGSAFSAITQSRGWKRSAATGDAEANLYGLGSPYGEQGNQQQATLGHCSFDAGGGCDSGSAHS